MKNLIFTFYLLFAFNIFYLTPFSIVSDIYLQFFTLLGIIAIVKKRYIKRKPYKYLILLLSILIISSIVSSMNQLNQGLVSALIATQHLFKGFSIFFFINWLEKDKVNIQRVIKWLIQSSWLFAIYVGMVSLFDITFTSISPLSGVELKLTGAKYDKALIFIGVIYYFISYFKFGKTKYIIAAFILFSTTQMYDLQRGDFVFVGFIIIVISLYFRKSIGIKKLIIFSPFYIILIAIGISMFDLTALTNKFQQLSLLFEGKKENQIEDASVFIRIQETEFALKGFYEAPIFGNGIIRSSEKETLIGSVYFYPADVGIFGILYTFGGVGLTILFSFLLYLRKVMKDKLDLISTVFLMYSIYIYTYSFKDGMLLFSPIQIILCISLISILQNKKPSLHE